MALPDRVAGRRSATQAARTIYSARSSAAAAMGGQAAAMSKSKRRFKVRRSAKPKQVNLGSKGSFTIKHPGAFRAKAQAAGMSTAAYAQKMKGAKGTTGSQARSAIGLMAMHH